MLQILLFLQLALNPTLAWIVSDTYFLLLKHILNAYYNINYAIISILFNGGEFF